MTTKARERSICLKTWEPPAFLSGRKAQIRRPVKNQPPLGWDRHCWFDAPIYGWTNEPGPALQWHKAKCPFGRPGDTLIGKEDHLVHAYGERPNWRVDSIIYRATTEWYDFEFSHGDIGKSFNPPIYWRGEIHWGWHSASEMPPQFARFKWHVGRVWVERAQELSDHDAMRLGGYEWNHGFCHSKESGTHEKPSGSFAERWRLDWPKLPWESNPWVWCVELEGI